MVSKQGDRRRGALEEPILDTAARMFVTDGYTSTHMVDVAKAAGVSLATLYRYFPSKDELLDSAFRREVALLEAPWRAAAWSLQEQEDAMARYARVFYGYTVDWARNERALGLLLTMAETPGLLYAFFLDKAEVYEHWIAISLEGVLEDARWVGCHAVVSATGFYALLMRWARGRLRAEQADFPRKVPDQIPDARRPFHVARSCDFTAEELAEWCTRRRLMEFGVDPERASEMMEAVMRAVADSGDSLAEGA